MCIIRTFCFVEIQTKKNINIFRQIYLFSFDNTHGCLNCVNERISMRNRERSLHCRNLLPDCVGVENGVEQDLRFRVANGVEEMVFVVHLVLLVKVHYSAVICSLHQCLILEEFVEHAIYSCSETKKGHCKIYKKSNPLGSKSFKNKIVI